MGLVEFLTVVEGAWGQLMALFSLKMLLLLQEEDTVLQKINLSDCRLKSDINNVINALGSNQCLQVTNPLSCFVSLRNSWLDELLLSLSLSVTLLISVSGREPFS